MNSGSRGGPPVLGGPPGPPGMGAPGMGPPGMGAPTPNTKSCPVVPWFPPTVAGLVVWTTVGGVVLSMVAELAVAAGDPAPEASAIAASNGPTVVTVLAGTTRVVVFRDAVVLVPGTPTAVCAAVDPIVPVVAGVPGAPPWCVCWVACGASTIDFTVLPGIGTLGVTTGVKVVAV